MKTLEHIGKILNNKKVYSLRHISKELEEDKDTVTYLLLKYISKRIKNYAFGNYTTQNRDLTNAIEILKTVEWDNIQTSLEPYQKELQTIQKNIDSLKKTVEKNNKKYYYFLENIKNETQTMLKTIHNIQKEKGQQSEYQYMHYLIFDIKNIDYIENTINHKNEIPKITHGIINLIINSYFESIKKNNASDIQYYEKILDLYYEASNKEQKKNIIEKLKQEYKNTQNTIKKPSEHTTNILNSINQKLNPEEYNDFEENLELLNTKYGFYESFSKEALTKIETEITRKNKNYIDCRKKYTISIDDDKASIYEDAISLEKLNNGNYLLGIYISDIANLVPLESTLGKEMLIRSKDLYLPDRVHEIVPYDIRANLSLNEQKDIYAIGHFFEFSSSFELLHFDVKNTIVNINHHFKFSNLEEIDFLFLKEEELKQLKMTIDFLNKLDIGYIEIENYHKLKEWMRELGGIPNDYSKTQASILISKIMILTNYSVASYFDKQQLPFLYRVNSWNRNKEEFLKIYHQFKDDKYLQNILKILEKSYTPSTYSDFNIGHAGLNVNAYGHTTCPMRNYAAFLNQHLEQELMIEKEQITDKQVYYYQDIVKEAAKILNQRNQDMVQYQKEFSKLYYKNKKQLTKKKIMIK